jgi:iron complex outermembrane receptor protein
MSYQRAKKHVYQMIINVYRIFFKKQLFWYKLVLHFCLHFYRFIMMPANSNLVNKYFFRLFSTVLLIIGLDSIPAFAQVGDSLLLSSSRLKKLSLEELMNVEVTSVSMQPEKLTEVASAIQVITSEDIQRSSALNLPEALELAPNLQIEQANSHDFSITARGFGGLPSANGALSNKLLVMVDGRSVYSPLFGGVFWDVQNLLLADVDRIEVVSGPGGTLWGANAVNGVINIQTKSAQETQGVYVSQETGMSSALQNITEMRYGGQVGNNLYFRVYGQYFDQQRAGTGDSVNRYNMAHGGFRIDYYPSKANTFNLQGDIYSGSENDLTDRTLTTGQNIMGHFTHIFSDQSNLTVKLYTDFTTEQVPGAAKHSVYDVSTYDADIQYRLPVGQRQSILMGAGYSYVQDMTNIQALNPESLAMPEASGFIQDEISCIPDRLKLTVGSKLLHDVFTGYEIQPSVRLAFMPNKTNTIWASISRAVRTPSRFDVDFVEPTGQSLSPYGFVSEKVNAYELGYRVRPVDKLSLSVATFYNQYRDLRSINSDTDSLTPKIIENGQDADSWGLELSGNYQATNWWRLRGGYTFLKKDVWATSSTVLPFSASFEGVDPENQFMFQSMMDLPWNLLFDLTGRYAGALNAVAPIVSTPAYFTFDARLARNFKHFEFSVIGQNLLAANHIETGEYVIPRSVYAKITYGF